MQQTPGHHNNFSAFGVTERMQIFLSTAGY